ncbi:Nucleotide-binding alpha-beta plait [Penicillium cf. griseofulvum]|uniref:Nucleotide-binding alpha-beta plait n=1 Tax=Penicillium cf. griseofulvum TaxID=2972120 RepID=A0A9W9JME1_9EURO|nr:Nucleotide-binding alpha-beta plait [Penicillium cf. griseofulvum]KAJ5424363.1 Nucleotide-binding alpha-beta plait [Penicillium cf. griseofulvum]KAJ5442395.1 Nucleotide-binding alpha-beta plait [Penicillium cf. griseofulvum]
MTETTRLHITPFTQDILPSVLPASIRNLASDISFHDIPTFPENNYGYVTLPNMEAEKIKKKLNGSILKGKKFKVEAARPPKRHREEEDMVPENPSSVKKKSKKSKNQAAEDGVLEGFELPADRKVKRGWTEASDAKQERRKSEKKEKKSKEEKLQPKSKYTDKSECLFRATIPPNRASDATSDDKKAKKKKKSKDNVVHEFEKTVTQPSFLRTAEESKAPTATFEDGKGWVDSTGNLREPASEKISKDNYRPGQIPGAKEKPRASKPAAKDIKKRSCKEKTLEESSESEDYTSSSGSSSDEGSESESEVDENPEDSSASSDEDVSPQSQAETSKPTEANDVDDDTPNQSEADAIPTEDAQEAKQDSSAKEVHPLEALFKRTAPTASDNQPAPEAEAGFSFFGNDVESEDEPQMAEPQTPFTPFTKNDLQNRGQRSAAPTPDTTAATRHMTWNESEGEDSDEDVSIDSPVTKARPEAGASIEETEFAKWFWENRGDNNRAWKKRRRDAAKEQRQRDNRKKGFKGKS